MCAFVTKMRDSSIGECGLGVGLGVAMGGSNSTKRCLTSICTKCGL